MASITQPLREEHAELRPEIEAIRAAADSVGRGSPAALSESVERAHAFLSGLLIAHAAAEEEVLYPVVAEAMGSPDATRTMALDHAEIRRLTGRLGELRQALTAGALEDEGELRMVLYGLYVLIRLHLDKEEQAYLPLLEDRLKAEEAAEMFHRMEAAAARAKRQVSSG